MAAQKERRFQLFREGRSSYEDYLAEYPISFDRLTEEDYRRAADDARIRDAERNYRESIVLTRAANAPNHLAVALSQLGFLLHLSGRFAEARDALAECIQILETLTRSGTSDLRVNSSSQYHLGLLNLKEGHYEAARRRLGLSISIDEGIGDFSGKEMGQAALTLCPSENGSPEPASNPAQFSSAVPGVPDGTESELVPEYRAAEDEEVELPGIFSASTRESLWIMAVTDASVRQLREAAQRACPQHRELVILSAASESGALAPPPMEPGTSLCGAIFEVSPAALSNKDFRYWINWCINRAFEAADFRLFVHLNGISDAAFVELAARDSLVAELRDKVQMHRPDRLDLLEANLRSHLLRLEMTRDAEKGRRMRRIGIRFMGGASALILWLSILFWLGVSDSALFLGKARVIAALTQWIPLKDWLGIMGGVPLAWSGLIPVALLLQDWKRSANATVSASSSVLWMGFGLVVARASIWLPREIHASTQAIIVGGVLGLLLEAARRGRATSARSNLLRVGQEIAEKTSLPGSLLERGRADPKEWPLFASGSRVFISYSRSSAWGNRCADILHRRLKAEGCDSFLDRLSIPPGASWQHKLDEQIGAADVFIALCDEHSVQRPWVAAEVAAALVGRHDSGFPEIILLEDKSLTSSALANALPVFRVVIEAAKSGKDGAPRIVTIDDADLITPLVATLTPRHLARVAVFPSWMRVLLLVLASPLMLVASIAPFMGLPALVVGIGMKLGKVDLATWFRPSVLWWLTIALAAVLGTTIRQSIGARYDGFAKQRGRSVYSLLNFCAIGFVLVGIPLWRHLDGVSIVLAAVALWLGWVLTSAFTGEFKDKRSEVAAHPGT